LALARP